MHTERETIEHIIERQFGCSADEIGAIENVTNNYVYPVTAAGKQYFLKLYRSKDWPEEGKIPFVYRCLSQNKIPHAELVAYRRDDETYPNGYLIERKIQGTAAGKIQLDTEQETGLYAKLAELVSSVHEIRINNYGYIGSGVGCYGSIIDFFEDEFDRFEDALKDTISEIQLKKLKEKFLGIMHDFEDLPSILCHGDLSKKNVMMQDNGEISLIDWDDAMALNWMADVSRLTFWMKQSYSGQEYALFRNTFLEHYRTSDRKAEFDVFESTYHLYSALDSLVFSIRIGDRGMESRLKRSLDGICQATEYMAEEPHQGRESWDVD